MSRYPSSMVMQTKRRLEDEPSREAAVHLVETDEVEAGALQPADDVLEKARRHFQQPVRLEPVEPGRTHMMQGKDHAHPGHERPHEVVRGAEIERLEAPADDRFLQSSQCSISQFMRRRSSQLFIDNSLPLSLRFQAGCDTGQLKGWASRPAGPRIPDGNCPRRPPRPRPDGRPRARGASARSLGSTYSRT